MKRCSICYAVTECPADPHRQLWLDGVETAEFKFSEAEAAGFDNLYDYVEAWYDRQLAIAREAAKALNVLFKPSISPRHGSGGGAYSNWLRYVLYVNEQGVWTEEYSRATESRITAHASVGGCIEGEHSTFVTMCTHASYFSRKKRQIIKVIKFLRAFISAKDVHDFIKIYNSTYVNPTCISPRVDY